MAVHELRAEGPPQPEANGNVTVLASRRQRLAIVSTCNKLCGIAAYTQALERQLADLFDITVFDLDQYLLRSRQPRVREQGDRHIKRICADIAGFDAVNLQLEFGTLGEIAKDIERRFRWLVAAAPRLSVTFHTLERPPALPLADFAQAVAMFKWRVAADMVATYRRKTRLSLGVAKWLRRAQRRKPVSAIVHNQRDSADARHLHGFAHVFDHPLSFLSASEAAAVHHQATRATFPQLDPLPLDAKLIGVFGFLSDYKGFGTAVRALHHLPDDHHLLIFGAVHPNDIPLRTAIHPYVASLLGDAHVDAMLFNDLHGAAAIGLNLDIKRDFAALFGRHPRDLSGRVHFLGVRDNADFLVGMAICDVVVLPYLEVGQSASGPISLALELGCRIIASRTHTFLEFARYHPDAIEFFDIGNHLELAGRIVARRQYPLPRHERLRYTVETNRAVYLAANTVSGDAPPFRVGRHAAARRKIGGLC